MRCFGPVIRGMLWELHQKFGGMLGSGEKRELPFGVRLAHLKTGF